MNNIVIKKINTSIYQVLEYNKNINIKKINIKDYEELLNYYLYNILFSYNKNNYKKIINIIYSKFICNNNIVKDEASIIADDLLDKVLHINNRYITLPILVNNIKEYSITSIINNKDLDNVIKLIIIKLAIVNYIYKLY